MNDITAKPTTLVIFGATGDLSRRKLLPALLRLEVLGLLPECFNIIGFSTRAFDSNNGDEGFKDYALSALREHYTYDFDESAAKKLLSKTRFIRSTFEDSDGYTEILKRLDDIDQECGVACDRVFYLATPPTFFPVIIDMLSHSQLADRRGRGDGVLPRIIIEKPFGQSSESSAKLNDLVLNHFDEEEVYRIDHYLGKETVQNILFFRFGNSIYEPLWNQKYIDHIQITVAESDGIGTRGKYYEEAGALRDMVQNHIMQLLALVAMEPPTTMTSENIRSKKVDLIESIRPVEIDNIDNFIVRGRYGKGIINGETTVAYRDEANVSSDSTTETFVALKVFIDNWRWSDVPFYIRTGKRLKARKTEIAVTFKAPPHCLFGSEEKACPKDNVLVLKIQPDEGIDFDFNIKYPGTTQRVDNVTMDFSYKEAYDVTLPEAYERLLLDCITGDSTLFPHKRAIETSWKLIDEVLKGWQSSSAEDVADYLPGSAGPKEADLLIERDGRKWRDI